jgi:uncharacterized membrane protein
MVMLDLNKQITNKKTKQTNKQTNKQTSKQTNKQTNKQDMKIKSCTYTQSPRQTNNARTKLNLGNCMFYLFSLWCMVFLSVWWLDFLMMSTRMREKKEIFFTLAHMSWSIISVAETKIPCSLHYEYLNSPNILPDLVY